MKYFSGIVVLAISLHLSAADKNNSSPQYIYMDRLRQVTKPLMPELTADTAGEDAKTPGILLATSIKDTCKFKYAVPNELGS